MPLAIRAQVVDLRLDSPRNSDCFLVDTNAWYWLFYSRASLAPNAPQAHQLAAYSNYLKAAINADATLKCCGLTFAELAHNIEKAERLIYGAQAGAEIPAKVFRHDYPNQRRKLVTLIAETWADVRSVSTLLELGMNDGFMQSALSLYPSVCLDGYDLFIAETAIQTGITHVVTDDGDYATVPGLTVFTANPRVIQAAQTAGRLLSR